MDHPFKLKSLQYCEKFPGVGLFGRIFIKAYKHPSIVSTKRQLLIIAKAQKKAKHFEWS